MLSANDTPRELREALNQAFFYRAGVKWRAGKSELLGVDYTAPAPGAVVDVRRIPDFNTVRRDRGRISIGAFIDTPALIADAAVSEALGGAPADAESARFRLAALGADLVIAGPGATRTVPLTFELDVLPAHEIPVAVQLRAGAGDMCFGNRRLTRKDGAASFDLHVHIALGMIGAHRISSATACATIDGYPVPLAPVSRHLAGTVIARTTFSEAAKRGADAFHGHDERTSVVRRTIVPLLLSALNDAYAAARTRAS